MQHPWGPAVIAGLLLVSALPGAPAPALAQAPELPEEAVHQVLAGDNLYLIAGYYYGDDRQWGRIFNANRDRIRNPNRIAAGMLLRVPIQKGWHPMEAYAQWRERALPMVTKPAGPGAAAPPAAPPAQGQPAQQGSQS